MKHQEYRRIVPGAENAVLFIHGICGTPNHFVEAIPATQWVPEGYSIHNLCLPGHGGTVADFAKVPGNQWRCHARKAFCTLAKTHKRVYIVGHSMGTLFALELAAEFPEKIGGLLLLGVPMRPHLTPAVVNSSLRLVLGKLRPGYPEEAIETACGVGRTWRLWEYAAWLPRFVDLFAHIARTEKVLGDVNVPTWIFQSKKDELVSRLSERVLARYPFHVEVLERSTHFYYEEGDTERVKRSFLNMIDHI